MRKWYRNEPKKHRNIDAKLNRNIHHKSCIFWSKTRPLASQSRSVAFPKSMKNLRCLYQNLHMRFVVPKLHRTKTNRKNDAGINEKTSILDPKRHAQIIKETTTKRRRTEKRRQNGAARPQNQARKVRQRHKTQTAGGGGELPHALAIEYNLI